MLLRLPSVPDRSILILINLVLIRVRDALAKMGLQNKRASSMFPDASLHTIIPSELRYALFSYPLIGLLKDLLASHLIRFLAYPNQCFLGFSTLLFSSKIGIFITILNKSCSQRNYCCLHPIIHC